eukprot:CAMPEP_0194736588 /NCGR_PEP_ID=MMETSP0296-20130528/77928_1 /TAXON_ID=39354 /ORGANISM="Heterosigma akashiwo, Strain CCMP2393" /LENGTH=34 /DNA_ID= /DNA_START= /DNA_END= /DNA_ORIENTATION=
MALYSSGSEWIRGFAMRNGVLGSESPAARATASP